MDVARRVGACRQSLAGQGVSIDRLRQLAAQMDIHLRHTIGGIVAVADGAVHAEILPVRFRPGQRQGRGIGSGIRGVLGMPPVWKDIAAVDGQGCKAHQTDDRQGNENECLAALCSFHCDSFSVG